MNASCIRILCCVNFKTIGTRWQKINSMFKRAQSQFKWVSSFSFVLFNRELNQRWRWLKRLLQSEFKLFQNSPACIFHIVPFIKCCIVVLSSRPPQNHWNKPVSRPGRTTSTRECAKKLFFQSKPNAFCFCFLSFSLPSSLSSLKPLMRSPASCSTLTYFHGFRKRESLPAPSGTNHA